MNSDSTEEIANEKYRLRFSTGWLFKAVAAISVIMMFSMVTGFTAIAAFLLTASVCLLFRSDPQSNFVSRIIFWFFVVVISSLWGMILGSYANAYIDFNSPLIMIATCSMSSSTIAFALASDFNRVERVSVAAGLLRIFLFGILGTLIGGAIYGVQYLIIGDHRLDVIFHLSIFLAIGAYAGIHIGLLIGSINQSGERVQSPTENVQK